MTLNQNEEIAKQIKEILAKGLTQKSLSPFTTLSILAPKNDRTWRLSTNSQAIKKLLSGRDSLC